MNNTQKRIGLIIPTLGLRPVFLQNAIRSVQRLPELFLVITSPEKVVLNSDLNEVVDLFVLDQTPNLAQVINNCVLHFPESIEYFGWLGDDDMLGTSSLITAYEILERNKNISAVFGQCEYIDQQGQRIGINSFGAWSTKLIRFGPNLVPQPGSLIRLESFNEIGKLDSRYSLAFDLDMFIRLKRNGILEYVPIVLGRFRWHSNSLTVRRRFTSVLESSKIRRSHHPILIRLIAPLWETPIIIVSYLAGLLLSLKVNTCKRDS
jgi:hypothetical protein